MKQNITKILLLLAGGLLLVTQPGASCVSDTGSDGGSTYDPPPRNDTYPPSQTDREEDPNYIPQRAVIVREGRGALTWTTDADGTIYIQNLRRERTELSRRVHRGQLVSVLPEENRIRIDDDTASKADLKSEDVHRIYVLRDRRFEEDRNDRNDRNDRSDRNDRVDDSRPPRGIPAEAQLMGDGKNKEIGFSPSKSGSVYVYSVEDRRLVSRIAIRSGERFVLSPGRARAAIDGKAVEQNVFNTRTTYRVYFNREG